MKNLFFRIPIVVRFASISLVCLGVGFYIFALYPARLQMPRLMETAKQASQEYIRGDDAAWDNSAGGATRTLVFRTDAQCVYYAIPDGALDTDPSSLRNYDLWLVEQVRQQIKSGLRGEEFSRVNFVWIPQLSRSNALIIAGVPIMENETVTGVLVKVKNDATICSVLKVFLLVYAGANVLTICILIIRRQKRESLKELNRIKNNYIANMTHALKTPLASVKALAELLCDEIVPDSQKQHAYCGRILMETKNLERTIHGVLKLSEIQSWDGDFEKEIISPNSCFDAPLEKYGELCEYLNISFHISNQIYQLPLLYTNANCLETVLEVLLDNAVKFAPDGNIWVAAAISKGEAVVSVKDDGIGIQPNDLPCIFERFYKGSGAGNENGNGLGLAIAKETIEHLGERIWVNNNAEKGVTFYFTVCLA